MSSVRGSVKLYTFAYTCARALKIKAIRKRQRTANRRREDQQSRRARFGRARILKASGLPRWLARIRMNQRNRGYLEIQRFRKQPADNLSIACVEAAQADPRNAGVSITGNLWL